MTHDFTKSNYARSPDGEAIATRIDLSDKEQWYVCTDEFTQWWSNEDMVENGWIPLVDAGPVSMTIAEHLAEIRRLAYTDAYRVDEIRAGEKYVLISRDGYVSGARVNDRAMTVTVGHSSTRTVPIVPRPAPPTREDRIRDAIYKHGDALEPDEITAMTAAVIAALDEEDAK